MGSHDSHGLCLADQNGHYRYHFDGFRFLEAIPSRVRSVIEAVHSSSSSPESNCRDDGVSDGSRGDAEDCVCYTPLHEIALSNLIFLFHLLLRYKQAAHCETFYRVVGEDLDRWPEDVVKEAQRIFVNGRRLYMALPESLQLSPTNPRVQLLCDLVQEWSVSRPTPDQLSPVAKAQPTEELQATWDALRRVWCAQFRSDPNSILIKDDNSLPLPGPRHPPPLRPRSPPINTRVKLEEDEVSAFLATIPVGPSNVRAEPSPIVCEWVSRMSNTAPEAGSIARIESSSPLFSPLEISFPHAPGVYRDQADERADTPIVTENPCKLQHTPDLDDFLVANASRDSDFPMVSRDSLEANIEVDTDDNTDFDAYADVDLDDIAFVNASGEPATSLSAKECPGGSAKQSKRSAKRERARLRRRNNGSSKKPPVPTQAPRSAPAQAPSQAPARDLPQALEEATRVALQSTRASAQYHQLPSKPPPVVNSALVRDASSQSTKAGNGSRATPPVTGTPTYTARRTSSSFRRRQESLDSPVTVPPKPLVRNSISALASAAVASAFTPVRPREHSPAASPSPAAVSSTSSATTLEAVPRTTPPPPSTPPIAKKALVNSTPEKLTPQEKRAAAKPRANGQEVSNVDKDGDTMTGTTDDSDKEEIGTPRRKTPEKTPPKSPQKKTTPLKGRPVVKPKPRITSPDKGHLNDDDTITDSSEAGVVPSARRTATTSPRPIKKSATLHSAAHAKKPTSLEKSKKARRLSSDSLEGAPERPRKRVSFGGVSYHEPEFQPAGTAVTTGIPSLRPASTLTVSGPVAPAKTLVPAPVNIPPGARLFPIYPGGRSRSRDVTPENAPAKSTAITKTIPPAALQDARQTINQGTVQDTALKEDVLPPGSLFRAAETSNTPGAQETVLEASGSLFITKAADSRECEIANLLLSMKKQINENMVELKRLMEPESEDFMVSCHLEMVEAQLQVLSLATYATWHKITSNKRGNENFQD